MPEPIFFATLKLLPFFNDCIMKIKNLLFSLFTVALIAFCNNAFAQADSTNNLNWTADVGAKQFPSATKIFLVKAKSDTSKIISKQIQDAIDKCAKSGGGIVSFNPGIYVTGAI
jgi:hypothetical protein